MLVQELKTIVLIYLVHWLKNNTVFSECVHAYSTAYMIFMFNAGCPVQYWGITLTDQNNLKQFFLNSRKPSYNWKYLQFSCVWMTSADIFWLYWNKGESW